MFFSSGCKTHTCRCYTNVSCNHPGTKVKAKDTGGLS